MAVAFKICRKVANRVKIAGVTAVLVDVVRAAAVVRAVGAKKVNIGGELIAAKINARTCAGFVRAEHCCSHRRAACIALVTRSVVLLIIVAMAGQVIAYVVQLSGGGNFNQAVVVVIYVCGVVFTVVIIVGSQASPIASSSVLICGGVSHD